ncbi:MAG: hypothetical protein ACR2O6_15565 [Ilumatobacteraceae bacterium]
MNRSPTPAAARRVCTARGPAARSCRSPSTRLRESASPLAAADTSDVVDAHVVIAAHSIGAMIFISDVDDSAHLVSHLPTPIPIRRP